MPSPFPGMDPWLEDATSFRDLQFSFCVLVSGALNASLPQGYYSRTARREWWEPRRLTPVEPTRVVPLAGAAGSVALPGPEEYVERKELLVEVHRLTKPENELVATLEVVSRDAKSPGHPAGTLFVQRQRQDVMWRRTRVEIDLTRVRCPHTLAGRALALTAGPAPDYCVGVFRGDRPAEVTVHGFRLGESLPEVEVPLAAGDPVVRVALQPILDRFYVGGGCDRWIDYRNACDPPLAPEQAAWAAGVLAGGAT